MYFVAMAQVTCQPGISNEYLLQMAFVPKTATVIAVQGCRRMSVTSCERKEEKHLSWGRI